MADHKTPTLRIDGCTQKDRALRRSITFDFEARAGSTKLHFTTCGSIPTLIVYASDEDMIRLMRVLIAKFPLDALGNI